MCPDRPRLTRRAALSAASGAAALAATRAAAEGVVDPGSKDIDTSEGAVIAVVGDPVLGPLVRDGVQLKVDQINATLNKANRTGGLLATELRLYDASADLPPQSDAIGRDVRSAALSVARRVMGQRGLIGVIGHATVDDALPASITYLNRGIPFIATSISSSDLTLHGLNNLFAIMPDNAEISTQTARISYDIGRRRAVILRDRSDGALETARAYRNEAAVLGLEILDERSLPKGSSPRDYLAGLQGKRIDHLLIIGSMDMQIDLVRFAHAFGLPVLCVLPTMVNVEMFRDQLLASAPRIANGRVDPSFPRVLMPVLRARSNLTTRQVEWGAQFKTRFGVDALDLAMQGTDALGLLAAAYERAGRFNVNEVKRVMHGELAYTGVGGRISFRSNGRIYTRLLNFASVRVADSPNIVYYPAGA